MSQNDRILLAHGGGGQLTSQLLSEVILPAIGTTDSALPDSATLTTKTNKIAFTTDSFVIQPLEFPGGNIGKLAICGTVNDLAVCGATPTAIGLSLVLEEGLMISQLTSIMQSIGRTAKQAGAAIVTGDTKVVEKGGVDGMIINTSGVGEISPKAKLGFSRIETGDRIIITGPLGLHGLAVMARRKGLDMASELVSDCACLNELTVPLLEQFADKIKFMRDPTRGGLAAVLADVTAATKMDAEIVEWSIPVDRRAAAAAEILGLDLLTIANEGRLVLVVEASSADKIVQFLKKFQIASQTAVIGSIGEKSDNPLVELLTEIGGKRIVQMPYGEDLPRIC